MEQTTITTLRHVLDDSGDQRNLIGGPFAHNSSNMTIGAGYSGVSEEQLYLAQRGRCFYCTRVMRPRRWNDELDSTRYSKLQKGGKRAAHGWTRDHVFPKSLGYPLNANYVLACKCCNSQKSSNMPSSDEVGRAICLYTKAGGFFNPQLCNTKAAKNYRKERAKLLHQLRTRAEEVPRIRY